MHSYLSFLQLSFCSFLVTCNLDCLSIVYFIIYFSFIWIFISALPFFLYLFLCSWFSWLNVDVLDPHFQYCALFLTLTFFICTGTFFSSNALCAYATYILYYLYLSSPIYSTFVCLVILMSVLSISLPLTLHFVTYHLHLSTPPPQLLHPSKQWTRVMEEKSGEEWRMMEDRIVKMYSGCDGWMQTKTLRGLCFILISTQWALAIHECI